MVGQPPNCGRIMKQTINSIVIIGATSGIGRAVAEKFAKEGVRVGIAGRREERLRELQASYGAERVVYRALDVTREDAAERLVELCEEVGTPDVLLYASGIGRQNPELEEEIEIRTVRTNCEGMVRIVDRFINWVKHNPAYGEKHRAHVAVISSVAGTKGMGPAPAYSATKSMQSAYLVALAQHIRMHNIPATVGDIRPGFVATEILNPEKHYPMMMTVEEAANHVTRSLVRRKRVTVFDWRYRLLVAFWRMIPRAVWERMTFVRN